MKNWIALYDYYLAAVPGCTYSTGADALRRATQEFCERTRVWRATLAPIVTVANQSIYPVPLAAGQELVRLLSANLGGRPVTPLLGENEDDGSQGVLMLSQREILVQPSQAAGIELVLHVALKPSNDAAGMEDFLYDHHAEAIANGAKARLYETAGQEFTDAGAAQTARARFDEAIARTIMNLARAHSNAPLRVRPSFM